MNTPIMNISPLVASTLVVLLPFIAFLIQAIAGRRSTWGIFSIISIVLIIFITAVGVVTVGWSQKNQFSNYEWLTIGEHRFAISILLGNVALLMQPVVCLITLPVHISSKSYVKSDTVNRHYWIY